MRACMQGTLRGGRESVNVVLRARYYVPTVVYSTYIR